MEKYEDMIMPLECELKLLENLESKNDCSFDDCAATMGNVLKIIVEFFIKNLEICKEQKEIILKFAYDLGQWLYVVDAYDDLEKDYRKNKFNPLLEFAQNQEKVNLNLILDRGLWITKIIESQLKRYMCNMTFSSHEEIVCNIIVDGLQREICNITYKKQVKEKSKNRIKDAKIAVVAWVNVIGSRNLEPSN